MMSVTLALLVSAFGTWGATPIGGGGAPPPVRTEAVASVNEDPAFIFTLSLTNGTEMVVETTVSRAAEVAQELDSSYELYRCTAVIEGWGDECAVTAETCDAARAGRNACACLRGLTVLCEDEPEN